MCFVLRDRYESPAGSSGVIYGHQLHNKNIKGRWEEGNNGGTMSAQSCYLYSLCVHTDVRLTSNKGLHD